MKRSTRHHEYSLAMRVMAFVCVGLSSVNAAMACPGAMAAMALEAAAKAAQAAAQQKRGQADQKEQQAKQAEDAAKQADERAKQADEAVKKAADEAREMLNQQGAKPPVDQAAITKKQQELREAEDKLKQLEAESARMNAPLPPSTPRAPSGGARGLTSGETTTGATAVQSVGAPGGIAAEIEAEKQKIAKLRQEISALQASGQGGSTKPVDAPALKAANEKVKQLSEAAKRAHEDADKAHQAANDANKNSENGNKDAEGGGQKQSAAADAAKAAADAAKGIDDADCTAKFPPLQPDTNAPKREACKMKCQAMAQAVKAAAGMIKTDGQQKQQRGQQGQQQAQQGQQQEQQLSAKENKFGQEAGGVGGAAGTGIDYSMGALGGMGAGGSGNNLLDVTAFEIGGVQVGSDPSASGANIGGATGFGAGNNPLESEYAGGGGDSSAGGNISGSDISGNGTVGGGRNLALSGDAGGGAGSGAGADGAGYNFNFGAGAAAGGYGAGLESGASSGSDIPGFGAGDSAKSDNPALDHQSNYRALSGLDIEEGSSRRLLTLWERAALRNQYFDIETGLPLADGRGKTLASKNQMLSKAASRLGSDPTVIFMDKNAEAPKAVQPASAERK